MTSHKKPQPGIFTPGQQPVANYGYPQVSPVPVSQALVPKTLPVPASFRLSVQVIPDPHATAARAELFGENDYAPLLTATGSAKKENGDPYDPEVGIALAVSRALDGIARKLDKKARGKIRHAESVQKDKAASRKGEHPYTPKHAK
jgi:hypothetical protein